MRLSSGRQGAIKGKVRDMAALLALLSSALWGTADFFGGKLSKKHSAFVVLGAQQFFGFLTGAILVIATGAWHAHALGKDGYLIPGILAGFAGYAGLVCLYAGLSTGRMGVVSPISSLSAVIPLGYALIYKGDQLSLIVSVGVVLATLGGFLASGPEVSQGLPLKPVLLALGAAVSFGTALIFMSIGSKSSALMTMATMRTATVLIGVYILLKARNYRKFSSNELPVLIFIGVADFAANLLLGIATTKGLLSLAMVLGSLYPIATALLAFQLLHERLHKVQYVGIFCAVTGVALISAF
jgi:drug/metabolite transporter (DMT)-like permease